MGKLSHDENDAVRKRISLCYDSVDSHRMAFLSCTSSPKSMSFSAHAPRIPDIERERESEDEKKDALRILKTKMRRRRKKRKKKRKKGRNPMLRNMI